MEMNLFKRKTFIVPLDIKGMFYYFFNRKKYYIKKELHEIPHVFLDFLYLEMTIVKNRFGGLEREITKYYKINDGGSNEK